MRIAVVGAGISGLAAAARLAESGQRVVVLDKGRGPGGRATTRRRAGHQFDHGAQYFTTRDPRFARRVASWRESGLVAEWRPRLATIGSSVEPSSVERLVGVPGMDALAKSLASSLDVKSRVRAESLERTGAGWLVRDASGELLAEADGVVIAIPPAQAKDLIPPGEPLADRVDPLRLAPCWAVLAAFDGPVEVGFDAAFVNAGPLRWIADDSSKPGRPMGAAWVLHASPEWSVRNSELPRERIATELLAALDDAAGMRFPEPAYVEAHRWRFAIPSDTASSAGPSWDSSSRLGVCGDWCHNEGRLEGAWVSGIELADLVLHGAGP